MFSAFNPSKFTHTLGAVGGSVPCSRVSPQSWTIPRAEIRLIWGAMSSASVGPLYFLKTNFIASVYQEILKHFMLPFADQLFNDADFILQQDLAPAHTSKSKCV